MQTNQYQADMLTQIRNRAQRIVALPRPQAHRCHIDIRSAGGSIAGKDRTV